MWNDIRQYIVLILWGIGMWFWGRFWHQTGAIRFPMLVHYVNASKWLIFLCGRPRPDGRLELAGIVFQIAMLLDLLLIPVFWVFSVPLRKRGFIFMAVFGMAIILAAIIRMIIRFSWRNMHD